MLHTTFISIWPNKSRKECLGKFYSVLERGCISTGNQMLITCHYMLNMRTSAPHVLKYLDFLLTIATPQLIFFYHPDSPTSDFILTIATHQRLKQSVRFSYIGDFYPFIRMEVVAVQFQ